MDFVLSGVAACGACVFTNPLEVVKTRMQLQGELRSRGTYQVYYRNVFHAFYTIGKVDGLAGLQKGLVPGLVYQFLMNGVRLGSFAIIESAGYIHTDGRVSAVKTTVAGAVAGVAGAVMGSPVYLVSQHQTTTNGFNESYLVNHVMSLTIDPSVDQWLSNCGACTTDGPWSSRTVGFLTGLIGSVLVLTLPVVLSCSMTSSLQLFNSFISSS